LRNKRAFPDGAANASTRPFADLQGRSSERARSARKRSSTNAEVAPMRRSLAATERKTAQAAAASGRGCVSQDGSGQFERRRIGRAFKPSGKLLAAIGF
jgi:hypothetical protein